MGKRGNEKSADEKKKAKTVKARFDINAFLSQFTDLGGGYPDL